MKKRTWYKLDNAAKIYPSTTGKKRSAVFAVSATLTEFINKDFLNEAVNNVLQRFPTFKVKLRRGVFWYYLEENKKPFCVAPQPAQFLRKIKEKENNDFLFKVFYLENKITLSIFHVLCDGTGAMEFLKAILFEYLHLNGYPVKSNGELKTLYSPSSYSESKDGFLHAEIENKGKPEKETSAYKLSGTPFARYGNGITIGRIKTDELKVLAKQENTTITAYLAGLLTFIIYENYLKGKSVKNKNLRVLIPINMRKIYNEETLRNFALFSRVGGTFTTAPTLSECIQLADQQIKHGSQKNVLDSIIASHLKAEKNLLLKIAPLFIKDIALKIAYTLVGDNLHTTTLSNLGIINLPPSVAPYVQDFNFFLNTSLTAQHALAVSTYNGYANLSFTREFVETGIERGLFRYLTANGVNVEISSNYWEDEK